MMKRLLLSVVFTLCLLWAGCQGNPSDTPGEKPRVALIMKSLANEFFVTMADGARAHQERHADAYALIVNGIKDESDLSQQVVLVEQMISIGVERKAPSVEAGVFEGYRHAPDIVELIQKRQPHVEPVFPAVGEIGRLGGFRQPDAQIGKEGITFGRRRIEPFDLGTEGRGEQGQQKQPHPCAKQQRTPSGAEAYHAWQYSAGFVLKR